MSYNKLGPYHRAVVRQRTEQGFSATQIAQELNIARRSVYRHRQAMGISKALPTPISAEEDARIRDMLQDGVSIPEIGRTLNRDRTVLWRRYKGMSKAGSMSDAIALRRQLGLELT